MNKQFVAKMLQAKQLEYEALKEIMPECIVNRINKLGDELLEVAKECFVSAMGGASKEDASKEDVASDNSKARVNKITIE